LMATLHEVHVPVLTCGITTGDTYICKNNYLYSEALHNETKCPAGI